MKNKFGVKVMPREVILDTQGRAVEQTLKLNQLSISSCRVGKYVELEIEGTEAEAFSRAQEIAKKLLHNPLIETFEVSKIGTGQA
jgi:phosphoribosylformylglycinamidine synthase